MRVLVLLSLSLLYLAARAQTEPPLRFERVEGLSHNTAYSIEKDRQGFLWVGTANGLNRFDGVEVKVYKPALEETPGQMRGRVIRSRLLEDSLERIWFATDLTVHCFDKRTEGFRTYNLLGAPIPGVSGKVSAGRETFANPLWLQNDRLWLANAGDGVFEFNTRTHTSAQYPQTLKDEAGNPIKLMYHGVFDGRQRLWFATSKGLLSFHTTRKTWQRHLPGRSLYSLSAWRDTLYVSEGKELLWFCPENGQHGTVPFRDGGAGVKRDLIHCVYADSGGSVWAGDEKGNVYGKAAGATHLKWRGNINGNARPRTNYPVYYFYSDRPGRLWIGSYALGLLKAEVSPEVFGAYPHPDEEAEDLYVNTIYEDGEQLWLGTFEKGIRVLDRNTRRTTPLRLPYSGPRVTYGNSVPLIQADSRGNVWTSLSGYLFVREKGGDRFSSLKMPTPSNALQVPQLWCLAEYKGGWLAGTTIGLYHIRKEKGRYVLEHLGGFGQARIFSLWVSSGGDIWVAYESGGVTIARGLEAPQGSARMFAQTNVRSFLHDEPRQLLWICTSSGLIVYHLPTGRYQNFTEADGLHDSYVYGALAQGGDLWVSTNNGLSRAELSFSGRAGLPGVRFTNFTTADGLPDNVFNARAFHRGKDGTLYFGTPKGVTWFRPGDLKPRQDTPTLRMIELLVNGHVADSAMAAEYVSGLELPYHKNNLFFRFRGIDYNNARKIHYAYRLEGWDRDWIYGKQTSEVRYSNLPPGHYTFRVKATDGLGLWTPREYTVSVTIVPPFWKSWWFYVLVGVAVAAAVLSGVRYWIRRKLREQRRALEKQRAIEGERNRISKDMHDEIGSGLTHIALISELVQVQQKSDEELRKDVARIAQSARRLVQSMGEIIWTLNPRNDTLESLLAFMREQTIAYFEPFELDYAISFPDRVPALTLTNEQRRNLFLVAKEALHNSLKHGRPTRIVLSLTAEGERLVFRVRDNGPGFDGTRIRAGANGLRNMEKRMQQIGGDFRLATFPGGTEVCFSLPLSAGPGRERRGTTFFTRKAKGETPTFGL